MRSKTLFIIVCMVGLLAFGGSLLLLLIPGCATAPVAHGLPNFRVVDAARGIYRGGQPDTNGLAYLQSIGVSNIVKLNLESEGPGWVDEDYAIGSGGSGLAQARVTFYCVRFGTGTNMEGEAEAYVKGRPCFQVSYLPITLLEQTVGKPKWVPHAVNQTRCFPGTYIHCEHGQDRTGLVCACYRVTVDGWSKVNAEKEMLANGFHKELRGLWEYWEKWTP